MVNMNQLGNLALIGVGGYVGYQAIAGGGLGGDDKDEDKGKSKKEQASGIGGGAGRFGGGIFQGVQARPTQASEQAGRGTPATSQEARSRVSRGQPYGSKKEAGTSDDRGEIGKDRLTKKEIEERLSSSRERKAKDQGVKSDRLLEGAKKGDLSPSEASKLQTKKEQADEIRKINERPDRGTVKEQTGFQKAVGGIKQAVGGIFR